MTDMMNEVDDDIRQQQLAAFWKENGPWIVGGALLAIVITASMSFWRGYELRRDTAATAQLMRAIDAGDAEGLASFADQAGKEHAAFARFAEASLLLRDEDKDKAVAIYDDIAATSGVDQIYRDLATLLSVMHSMDTGKTDILLERIRPLALSKNAWRFSALELQAMLYVREGRTAEALEILTRVLSDPAAPEFVRGRAQGLRELYLGGMAQ